MNTLSFLGIFISFFQSAVLAKIQINAVLSSQKITDGNFMSGVPMTISLNEDPGEDIRISLSASGDAAQYVNYDKCSVHFGSANYNTSQTILIFPVAKPDNTPPKDKTLLASGSLTGKIILTMVKQNGIRIQKTLNIARNWLNPVCYGWREQFTALRQNRFGVIISLYL
jgi:hypothetical protein